MTSIPFPLKIIGLLLAGACQTLSLAPFNYWPLGIISIVILLLTSGVLSPKLFDGSTKQTQASKTSRNFLYGWVFGLGLFGSGSSWVYVSIHEYGYAPPPLATFLTLIFVMGLALFHGFLFLLFDKLKGLSVMGNALIFSGLWVLGDGFRTVFLTGFPWLFLGYAHMDGPLAGWIPLLGVYGITLLTVLTGSLIAAIIHQRLKASETASLDSISNGSVRNNSASNNSTSNNSTSNNTEKKSEQQGRQRLCYVSFVAFIITAWGSGVLLKNIQWTSPVPEAKKSIALLQINIPQELKWLPSQRRKTLKLLDELSEKNWDKDIIVWPETAIPMLYDQARPYLERLSARAERHDTNIISGIPYRKTNPDRSRVLHNSVISLGQGEGIYHKQKLVPFGEYVPLQSILRGLIAFFDLPMSNFRTGPADQALLSSQDYKLAPFICYEVVYPDFVADNAVGADYLLTISNDSWFGTSIGPLQHLEMAQMRAAENGRYMVRATNNGVSAIIDEKGEIVARSEQFVQTVLESEIQIFEGQTPFSQCGSWPTWIFSLALVVIPLIRSKIRD